MVQHVKDKPYELLAFLPYRVTAAQFLGGVGPLPGVICLIDQENDTVNGAVKVSMDLVPLHIGPLCLSR